MVVGDYCEYDNFSCDGPRCNEGPYLYNDSNNINNSTSTPSEEWIDLNSTKIVFCL